MRQLGGDTLLLTARRNAARPRRDAGRHRARAVALYRRHHDPDPRSDAVIELARHASIPVINGLTRRSHPCQVLADVMTFEEHCGPIRGRTVAWTGDANNVLTSWMHAAERFEFRLRVATPPELAPKKPLLQWIKSSGAAITIGTDPDEAVKGADCVVTDTWVSMGDRNGARRHNLLKRYQVNAPLDGTRQAGCRFHALPSGASRRRGHRRGHRWAAFDRIRRSRKPIACPEGHFDVVPRNEWPVRSIAGQILVRFRRRTWASQSGR